MGPNYKDFYAVLGVGRDASDKEIKSAYRRLARKYHPDVNPGDKQAEERFKEIGEAHEILGDPEKRSKYDQYGDQWKAYSQAGAGGAPGGFRTSTTGFGPGPGGLEDLFKSLFGEAGFGAGGFGDSPTSGTRRRSPAGSDVDAEIVISLEEAQRGVVRNLRLALPGGRWNLDQGTRQTENRSIDVRVPAGISDGKKIRMTGQGIAGGDLYVVVRVAPHPRFERRDDDLTTEVPVPYTTAALGGEVVVPTLPGTTVKIRIPPGTQSGRSLRIAGHGMPRLKGDGSGDLLARIRITVPTQLGEREAALLRELASLQGGM
ncbi:MAG: DnaJ C-terminal domain-containing protein [Armatimonadota bacterium]